MHDARIHDPLVFRMARPSAQQQVRAEGKNWRLTLASIVAAAGIIAATGLVSPLITGSGSPANPCSDETAITCTSGGSSR